MTQPEIETFISSLENIECENSMGYLMYFVGNYRMVPFVSIAKNGNEYEAISRLDREGVFRVNIGVSPQTFKSLLPDVDIDKVDFAVLDTFLPHPHYAAQSFICILNPSEQNAHKLKQFIREAYSLAAKRQQLRKQS